MQLATAMEQLAKTISDLPTDLKIEVDVTTEVHDDVPPLFLEFGVNNESNGYRRVVESKDGIATKSIILWIHD